MGIATGLTAARMLAIEAASVVSGIVNDSYHLILTRHDGSTFDAGYVRGPEGPQGEPGSIEVSPAGGDLEGYYPNPTIKESAKGTMPTGSLLPYAGTSAPVGFLLCQGQEVSRVDYAALFAVIGTAYGPGDGSTTFLLPDMRDRFAAGASATKPLGTSGGSATKTLTEENLPPHDHAIDHDHASFTTASGGSHKHTGMNYHSNDTGTRDDIKRDGGSGAGYASYAADGAHIHDVNVPPYVGQSGNGDGTSTPFDVQNPYASVNFIIKT